VDITLQLKMDDKMNRQLTADFTKDDNAENLAQELVHYGFINKGVFGRGLVGGSGIVNAVSG
jgi:hypothetical protein